ncbi:MAG TPA: Hsp70 family protein [Micromonosporaceae bacterium]|jgi:molecular chaperone DnaK (HSP70)|nr:Hsp70 family protein [Micromonosporaceae bacterium]
MRMLGIDFGTSNTVAMLRMPDGRVRPLLFDGSPMLPSAVYLSPDGRMLVGRDAERNARVDPGRFEPNPKRRIDDGTVFLGEREMPVPRVIGYVLEQVLTEARRQIGGNPAEVRMTHPARWGERRRSILVEAARLAGLARPQLIAEPVGAASYFTAVLGTAVPVGRSLAIYDLGGGTFDATVVRRTQTGFEVLAEEGLPDVGGLDFDHAIVEHLGKTYSDSRSETWTKLITPQEAGDRRYRRMLYEDVRGCKEMLSRTSSTDVHLPALEVDAHLTREEFESLVRPYLERTVECLKRTIAQARQQPKDMVGIFLVGGSSRIPLAGHLIHTELGIAPTTLEQPETVVVEGALAVGGHSGSQRRPVSGMPRPVSPPQRPTPAAQPTRPVAAPRRPVSLTPAGRPPTGPRPPGGPPLPAAAPVRPLSPAAPGLRPPAQPPRRPVVGRPPTVAPPRSVPPAPPGPRRPPMTVGVPARQGSGSSVVVVTFVAVVLVLLFLGLMVYALA